VNDRGNNRKRANADTMHTWTVRSAMLNSKPTTSPVRSGYQQSKRESAPLHHCISDQTCKHRVTAPTTPIQNSEE
jgi:hypothetical protein